MNSPCFNLSNLHWYASALPDEEIGSNLRIYYVVYMDVSVFEFEILFCDILYVLVRDLWLSFMPKKKFSMKLTFKSIFYMLQLDGEGQVIVQNIA